MTTRGKDAKEMAAAGNGAGARGLSRREALMGAGLAAGAAATLGACTARADADPGRALAFLHGVASGDPTANRVVIWTRITPEASGQDFKTPVQVRWALARDPEMRRIVKRGAAATSADRDFTVKADVGGLEADQTYYYRFDAAGAESPVGKTKTLPAKGADKVSFVVCSCSNYPAGYFNAYRAIARLPELDLVIHNGDYIYEYGADGYAGETGAKLGRVVDPKTEILTLDDYRRRYRQYRTDPDLQAAHAVAPWITVWDDHETANDSWKGGAQNHNPERGEGNWDDRRKAAVQAYYEWLPIREPEAGRVREAINRRFDFGDLASFVMIETRLTGRSKQLDWIDGVTEIASALRGAPIARADLLAAPELLPAVRKFIDERLNDPSRAMMGPEQEAWVAATLKDSVAGGRVWQVLGNEVILARVDTPNFAKALSPENQAKLTKAAPYLRQLLALSQYGLPSNLDSWDGYPAARDRLYQAFEAAQGNVVVVTGDAHTAWANELYSADGATRLAVEFVGTSISSPGLGDIVTPDMADLGKLWTEKNREVVWHDALHRGFVRVTLTRTEGRADFHAVDNILSPEFKSSVVKSFRFAPKAGAAIGGLEAV